MIAPDPNDVPTLLERPAAAALDEALPERFELVREIARGGMGRVVEVFDRQLGRTVALKQSLYGDRGTRLRFDREVAITARLEHPSIVPLYDAGRSANGEPFYIMRRVTGAPLDACVRDAHSLDQRLLLLPHVLAMADAVAHAHQRGVIHRDLKPNNVLVGELGETIVIDWGLAKQRDESDVSDAQPPASSSPLATTAGAVIGTPGFMAPEQVLAEATDARTDVYALGACLFFVLAARPPFTGSEADVFARTLAGQLPSLALLAPGVPPDLVTIVHKAMARAPEHRYLDAGGFGEELRRFLGGQLVASHRYGTRQRFVRWVRKHRAVVIAVAAGAVVAVAVAAVSLQRVFAAQARTEAALQGEREHGDDLVVAQATAYLETDPTRAVATLAQLRAASARWATLGPLIADARALGIAGAYPGHGRQAQLAFASAGPPRLLSSAGGIVRLVELDGHHVTTLVEHASPRASGSWIGELLAIVGTSPGAPAELFDMRTSTRSAVAWPQPLSMIATAPGVLAFVDHQHRAATLEVKQLPAGQPQLVPGAADAGAIELSPSGQWLVLRGAKTQIFRRLEGAWTLAGERGATRLAPAFDQVETHVALVEEAPARAIVELALPTVTESRHWDLEHPVHALAYAGTRLYVMTLQPAEIMRAEDTGQLSRVLALETAQDHALAGAGGLVAVLTGPRQIVIGLPAYRREIRAPLDVLGIALDPGGRWLAGTSAAETLVWDLGYLRSQVTEFPAADGLAYLDDTTLVASLPSTDGARRPLELCHLAREPFAVTSREPLAAVEVTFEITIGGDGVVTARDPAHGTARVLRPALPGASEAARLPDGSFVTGGADGLVLHAGVELGHLPGAIDAIVAREAWLGARSRDGTLWRRDPAGAVETAAFAPSGTLVLGAAGTLYLVDAHDLYAWPVRGAPERAFHFAGETTFAHATRDGGVVVAMADGTLQVFDPDGLAPRVVLRAPNRIGKTGFAFSANGAIAAAELDGGIAAIDLRTGEHWMVVTHFPFTALAVSPDGKQLVATAGKSLHRFWIDVPVADVDGLHRATNAVVPPAGGELGWREPWD